MFNRESLGYPVERCGPHTNTKYLVPVELHTCTFFLCICCTVTVNWPASIPFPFPLPPQKAIPKITTILFWPTFFRLPRNSPLSSSSSLPLTTLSLPFALASSNPPPSPLDFRLLPFFVWTRKSSREVAFFFLLSISHSLFPIVVLSSSLDLFARPVPFVRLQKRQKGEERFSIEFETRRNPDFALDYPCSTLVTDRDALTLPSCRCCNNQSTLIIPNFVHGSPLR